jgi:hypothetical protein
VTLLVPADARCRHLTWDDVWTSPEGEVYAFRACVLCGGLVDRRPVLARLEAGIRGRHRLPPSPWTAAERSVDTA